ncbi:hypothetical protein AMK59_8579 [Oryctes borbonicus]|uniref:Endonuclease III homolog n=1 Tax=Oryctes borbonicus TaxID=1629725 RepID=A0A0T6AU29_9SCAR|nr:hypothetical protein AMK59_8579 [Oryctes borbonicus]
MISLFIIMRRIRKSVLQSPKKHSKTGNELIENMETDSETSRKSVTSSQGESAAGSEENKISMTRFAFAKKPQIQTVPTNTSSENVMNSLTKGKKRSHLEIQSGKVSTKLKKEEIKKSPNKFELSADKSAQSTILNYKQNWPEVLKNLREMRKGSDAPVDSMGCQQCMDKNANPKDVRYQALLALMLSSQTKDNVTHTAMLKLREYGCSIENLLKISDEKLGELIYPVSFWKRKVQYIKKTTEILKNKFDNDIPDNVEDLCKLPGVGPKMAHLCMLIAWNKVTGIGVDTHVHRISNRLGWVKTKTPEATRIALENLLPQELWMEVNQLLVGFGQQICQPVKPKCNECLNNKICPFANFKK